MITNPFRNRELRDWMCKDLDYTAVRFKVLSSTGSGPYPEAEFDAFLERKGFKPYAVRSHRKILIVGRGHWSESELRELLRARSGKNLRVYSQEMLIAFLLTSNDPLASASDVVERFGRGHPTLEFLSAIGFDWPTTEVHGGGGSELTVDWLRVGFLGGLGYKVGRTGCADEERHALLKRAYNLRRLPDVFPHSYRNDWGRPRSSVRLLKIAQSIATFCKLRKRCHNDSQVAIEEWEQDLEWLRITYYEGRYQFEWPKTEVW